MAEAGNCSLRGGAARRFSCQAALASSPRPRQSVCVPPTTHTHTHRRPRCRGGGAGSRRATARGDRAEEAARPPRFFPLSLPQLPTEGGGGSAPGGSSEAAGPPSPGPRRLPRGSRPRPGQRTPSTCAVRAARAVPATSGRDEPPRVGPAPLPGAARFPVGSASPRSEVAGSWGGGVSAGERQKVVGKPPWSLLDSSRGGWKLGWRAWGQIREKRQKNPPKKLKIAEGTRRGTEEAGGERHTLVPWQALEA